MDDVTMGNQQERREYDCHWLAGVFDGEGCITIVKGNPVSTGRFTLQPQARFVTSSLEIKDEFVRILNDHEVPFHIGIGGPSKIGTRSTWRISINGMKRVRRFLTAFLPYIRGKKREGEIASAYIESRILVPRNLPYRRCDLALHEQIRTMHGYRTRESSETTRLAAPLEQMI